MTIKQILTSPATYVVGLMVALPFFPSLLTSWPHMTVADTRSQELAYVRSLTSESPEMKPIADQILDALIRNEYEVYGAPLPSSHLHTNPELDALITQALKDQFDKERPAEAYKAEESNVILKNSSMDMTPEGDMVMSLAYDIERRTEEGVVSGDVFECEVTVDPETHKAKHMMFKDQDYYDSLKEHA